VQSLARRVSLWLGGPFRGAVSAADAALRWWLGELRALVPARLHDMLAGDGHEFRVRVDANIVHIEAGQGADVAWDLPLEGDDDLPAELQARLRGGAGAVLLLPAAAVLRRVVELPLAAASELSSATSFLVERLSPFRLEQACHTARLVARDKARKQIRAEVAVVPRGMLEALLAALSARSIPLCAVMIEGDTGKPPLDFLPRQGARSRFQRHAREPWRPVLAAALALMVVGPLTVAYRAHAEANSLAAEVARVAGVGGRAAALRTEVEARAAADAFMSTRQRRLKAIEVLEALTRMLPDDTWVFRMEARPGQVVFAGLSSDVAALLERLTSAPFAAPELISPVAHGLPGGKSRFEVRVQVRTPEP
jgi:general secretion pathway protein L